MSWKSSFQLISKSERSARVVVRTVYVILSHLFFVQCEYFESTETNRNVNVMMLMIVHDMVGKC